MQHFALRLILRIRDRETDPHCVVIVLSSRGALHIPCLLPLSWKPCYKGVESSDVGEHSSTREPPKGEGQKAGVGKRAESVAGGGSGQKAFEKGRSFYRDALKPFVDPKIKEVREGN